MDTRPNLFIIGCPRSGTTSLHYYLGQHPDIFMCEPKEPHFFGRDLTRTSHPRFQRFSEASYRALFHKAAGFTVRGEATSVTFASRTAADEIAALCPDASLLLSLRDPIDFAYSLFHLNRAIGREPEPNFAAAFRRELSPDCATPDTAIVRENLEYRFLIRRMHEAIEEYRLRFGSRFRVVLFDRLKQDPVGMAQRIFTFLKVDPNFRLDTSRRNAAFVPRNTALHALLRYGYLLRPIRRMISARPLGIMRAAEIWNRKPEAYPPLPDALRQELMPLVAHDYDELTRRIDDTLAL